MICYRSSDAHETCSSRLLDEVNHHDWNIMHMYNVVVSMSRAGPALAQSGPAHQAIGSGRARGPNSNGLRARLAY